MFNPYPKPEKVVKKSRKIPHQSKSMQVKNAEYHKVLDEINQDRHPWCECCGVNSFEHSHLVPRAFNAHAYMSVKKNIRRNCRECHLNWENARLHLMPRDVGRIYLEIVQSLDEQYYRQKVMQFAKNYEKYREKNWLAISNETIVIPKWVDEFFRTFNEL